MKPAGIDWTVEPLGREADSTIAARLGVSKQSVRVARIRRGISACPPARNGAADAVSPGARFGSLKVIGGRGGRVAARCDCGKERTVRAGDLRNGIVKECADCAQARQRRAAQARGVIEPGTRFARLVVEDGSAAAARCRCDCGAQVVVTRQALRRGKRTTCGECRFIQVGQRFGRLVVMDMNGGEQQSGRPRTDGDPDRRCVIVACDCGITRPLLRVALHNGQESCGCIRSRKVETPGAVPFRAFTNVRHSAESRSLPFAVTIEFLTDLFESQDRRCALTGWPIAFTDRTASLDRIDSAQGYTPENVQWTHKTLNKMKLDHPTDAFVAMCRAVAAHADRPRRKPGAGPGQLRLLEASP